MFTCTLSAKLGTGVVDVRDGVAGPIRLTLNCPNNSTVMWRCGSLGGAQFLSGIHVTISGSANDASVSVSYEQPAYG